MPFVICDVDDVLLEMGQISHLTEASLIEPLTRHFGAAQGEGVQREFMRSIGIMRQQLGNPSSVVDDRYQDIMARMAWWQRGVTEAGYEVKIWSRHALIACALEACALPVTAAVVNDVTDHYWAFVAQHAAVYSDAAALIQELWRAHIPVHLATGSDGFLIFDEPRQTFVYDPEDAIQRKLDRLQGLYELGFQPEQISIGDPVGKPSPAFFHSALRDFSQHLGCEIDLGQTIAIGDSLTHDILPLLELGAGHGVWLQRETPAPNPELVSPHPNVDVVTQLDAQRLHALFDRLM
ncbi:HAD family hydrolase [Candidatus Entotheonella palauensis]|uniref:HAD family hydrolase n=1 Tax=Candidatus Entotheonella palauensis TaxID=93172 RepID=UPI000B7CEF5A|nr:HAD family hydrolase [Candidatus Entotheonella palauensis]